MVLATEYLVANADNQIVAPIVEPLTTWFALAAAF